MGEERKEPVANGKWGVGEKIEYLNPELQAVLTCPLCHGELTLKTDEKPVRLVCEGCGRWFPAYQGIPMMLIEHEKNLLGEELNHIFPNPPGLAPTPSRRFSWYYNRPEFAGDLEMGEWRDFSYSDIRGRVLDIGAGNRHAIEALENVESYVSIDLIPRDRPTVVADAHYLPFRDGVFDAVVARAVLEHVEDEQKVTAEAARVLRPGGIFLFSAPFIYPIHDAVDHHRFTIYSIQTLARRHGFEIMRLTSSGGYFGVLADHIYHGLKMARDAVDRRYAETPVKRRTVRFFLDLSGMMAYAPFYLLNKLDFRYRQAARRAQGRIPYVVSYSAVFRKAEDS